MERIEAGWYTDKPMLSNACTLDIYSRVAPCANYSNYSMHMRTCAKNAAQQRLDESSKPR